ncbi:hypothetical protein F4811DRAFT_276713 [Daldinia bambusicola]|nr:hypothetical protein F4811DRAFT_276713 [Daldinia bambusicola]
MSSRDQPLSSNNPFRRKLGYPTLPTEGDGPVPVTASSFEKPFDPIPPTSFATFKSTPPEDEAREGRSEDTTAIQPKPKKVVKRVRVQSPPPSSPEDTGPVNRFPSVSDDEDDDDGYNSDHSDLPEYGDQIGFDADSFAIKDREGPGLGRLGPPANPFAKTLEDLEQSGQGQNAKSLAKGALDVDSFKRLLLTGHANFSGRPSASAPELGGDLRDQFSSLHGSEPSTDARPRSRQSTFDTVPKETSQISHPITGAEDPGEKRGALLPSPLSSAPPSSMKKKPPPPSSRHGKLIKIELGAGIASHTTRSPTPPVSTNATTIPSFGPSRKSNPQASTPLQSPLLPTDVNKPLPLTPFRSSVEEAVDSPFDREAIGRVPEPFTDLRANPEPLTPPLAAHPHSESNGITQPRKPAAPPPRRHGRSDSRAPSINTTNADEDTPPRSSMESNRSRTDSLRTNTNTGNNPNVPAPPPPRRPNHARHGSSFKSPSQANYSPVSTTASTENERNVMGTGLGSVSRSGQIEAQGSPATIITHKDGLPKLSPPPPPPTRQPSTRRPPSVKSVDLGNGSNTTRRVSREKDGGVPPPPPPPRQRGSSRASVENSAILAESTGNTSSDTQKEAIVSTQANTEAVADKKQGAEILADLDALQREVDALMGRYGKSGGS